jgi:hypothetical protein
MNGAPNAAAYMLEIAGQWLRLGFSPMGMGTAMMPAKKNPQAFPLAG